MSSDRVVQHNRLRCYGNVPFSMWRYLAHREWNKGEQWQGYTHSPHPASHSTGESDLWLVKMCFGRPKQLLVSNDEAKCPSGSRKSPLVSWTELCFVEMIRWSVHESSGPPKCPLVSQNVTQVFSGWQKMSPDRCKSPILPERCSAQALLLLFSLP